MDSIDNNVSMKLSLLLLLSPNTTQLIDNSSASTQWQTWSIGLILVSITAFAPSVGILLVPLLSEAIYERFMTFLVALGVGTLSGSTLYILIPQAFNMDALAGLDYIQKSSTVISAVYAFFAVDRALAFIIQIRKMRSMKQKIHQSTLDAIMCDKKINNVNGQLNDTNNNTDISTADSQLERESNQLKNELEVAIVSNALTRTFSNRRRSAVIDTIKCGDKSVQPTAEFKRHLTLDIPTITINEPNEFLRADSIHSRRSCALTQETTSSLGDTDSVQDRKVSVSVDVVEQVVIDTARLDIGNVAYMIMFGSSANNFVDGVSMGAAFTHSFSKGLSVGIAVIAQQFPQELGTLAILVKSELGFKRAVLLNLIPNSLSFVGFVVGVFAGGTSEECQMYIFSISSGMYLYVFLGTLIPEIRDSINELMKTNFKESILSTALQVLGIGIGVTFMYTMCICGRDIHL